MNGLLTPFPVRTVDVYDDGEDARHYSFEPLSEHGRVQAAPGQFFLLTVPGRGEAAFTYVSLPDENGRFSALVRAVGGLTRALSKLQKGAVLGCRGPFGNGWPMEVLTGKRVLLLAGGCGLAPLAAVVDALSEMNSGTKAALIYGARNPGAQVLSRERKRWRSKIALRETFDRPGEGIIHVGTPLQHVDDVLPVLGGEPEVVFTCGPEIMMNTVGSRFVARGLPPEKIWLSLERRMHCGVGLCGHCYVAHTYACKEGPTYRWDEIETLRVKSPKRNLLPQEIRHC